MVWKCANSCCRAVHHEHEGKLFRFDIEIGCPDGEAQNHTEYLWLCHCCAQMLQPIVEVADNTVRLRLVRKLPPNTDTPSRYAQAN